MIHADVEGLNIGGVDASDRVIVEWKRIAACVELVRLREQGR